jgi:ketosteroid isomerase-like protein
VSTEENKALALRFLNATAEGVDIFSLMTEDATWWLNGTTEFSGLHKVRPFFELVRKAYTDAVGPASSTFGTITAEGDRVCVETTPYRKFKDGRVYTADVMVLLTIRDGKIASVKEYLDTERLTSVFGGRVQAAPSDPNS